MAVAILSSAVGSSLPETDYADLVLHVNARIISAARARRKANGWLAMEAGDRVVAGEPELVIDDQLRWRVPVHWTSPTKGLLAERVCDLLLDAVTGDVPDPQAQLQMVLKRVAHAARPLLPTEP